MPKIGIMIDNKIRIINKELLKQAKDKCIICGETEYCCLQLHHIKNK